MFTMFTTYSTTQWTQPSILQLSPELSILIIIAINHCTMFQIPKHVLSTRDLSNCLQQRLSLWNRGGIDALLSEGRFIPHQLLSRCGSCQKSDDHRIN